MRAPKNGEINPAQVRRRKLRPDVNSQHAFRPDRRYQGCGRKDAILRTTNREARNPRLEPFQDCRTGLAKRAIHIPFRGYHGTKVLGERDSHEGRYLTPSTPYASVLITPQWRVEEALRGSWKKPAGGSNSQQN